MLPDDNTAIVEEVYRSLQSNDIAKVKRLVNEHFDDTDPRVSSVRAYICQLSKEDGKNVKNAIRYFEIGANNGRIHDQRELGLLLYDEGETERAAKWLGKASSSGDSEATLKLFFCERKRGDVAKSLKLLLLADQQGNPRATQRLAIEMTKGHFGLGKIFTGIKLYLVNVPKLMKYSKSVFRKS